MSQTPVSRGSHGVVFGTIFIALSLWAVREMRLGPVTQEVGRLMLPAVDSGHVKEYTNLELRTHYTGVSGIDYGIRFLVVAFLPGALGIDKGIMLQQAYFLASFFSLISIYCVEAGRSGNAGRIISL